MSIKTTLLSFSILLIVLVGWWLMPPLDRPPTQVMIVNDRSDSTPGNCDSLTILFQKALTLPGINRHSMIAVVSLGDGRTANEPYLIGQYKAPDTRYVIEGKRKIEAQRKELVADLLSKCSQSPITKVSPIYLAIKRAVEQLQSMSSDPKSALYLFVKTDGEETAEQQIKIALSQPPGSKLHLPSPINNERIRISFCGIAETIGDATDKKGSAVMTPTRNTQRIDRAREVWGALFSTPTNVTFEPYCQQTDVPATKRLS